MAMSKSYLCDHAYTHNVQNRFNYTSVSRPRNIDMQNGNRQAILVVIEKLLSPATTRVNEKRHISKRTCQMHNQLVKRCKNARHIINHTHRAFRAWLLHTYTHTHELLQQHTNPTNNCMPCNHHGWLWLISLLCGNGKNITKGQNIFSDTVATNRHT